MLNNLFKALFKSKAKLILCIQSKEEVFLENTNIACKLIILIFLHKNLNKRFQKLWNLLQIIKNYLKQQFN